MTIVEMINQGDTVSLLIMGVIVAGIITMIFFFKNELKKALGEKKNDQQVVSNIQSTGNSAVTAAISAAVNEYGKNK